MGIPEVRSNAWYFLPSEIEISLPNQPITSERGITTESKHENHIYIKSVILPARRDAATSWPFDTFFHFGSYFCINQTKILYLGSVLRDVKLTPLCDTHSSVSSMSPFGSSCHGPDHHLCSLWSGKNPELNNFWSGWAERGNLWGLGGLEHMHWFLMTVLVSWVWLLNILIHLIWLPIFNKKKSYYASSLVKSTTLSD